MCLAEKCCFFIKMDLGCNLIGLLSFILALTTTVSSAVLISLDHFDDFVQPQEHELREYDFEAFTKPHLTIHSLKIILYVSLLMGSLMLVASSLLFIGLKKKQAGYLLCYFTFGLIVVIVSLLGAMLFLIHKMWGSALVLTIIAILFTHFLVVVHTVYEGMQRGKDFGFAPHSRFEEDYDSSVDDIQSPASL